MRTVHTEAAVGVPCQLKSAAQRLLRPPWFHQRFGHICFCGAPLPFEPRDSPCRVAQ